MVYTRRQGLDDCCEFFGLQRDCIGLVVGDAGLALMADLWEHDPANFYENPLQLLRQEWYATVPRYLHPGFFASLGPEPLLDYGCGVGALTRHWAMQGHPVAWVEVSDAAQRYLRWQREKYHLSNVQIIHATDFSNWIGYWGGLVCVDVLEHIASPMDIQQKLWSCLRVGAPALVKLEPCFPHPGHLRRSCEQYATWRQWVAGHAEIVEEDTYIWAIKRR